MPGDEDLGRVYHAEFFAWYAQRVALLRELSQCPRALTKFIMPKQVRKTNLDMFLVPFQKTGWKIDHHVSNLTPSTAMKFKPNFFKNEAFSTKTSKLLRV